ncbi:MAG TPA: histidine kinase [Thermoleophilaceae bacterium]|nr:histidine kinase [Thermoleophilaceae bacterium]
MTAANGTGPSRRAAEARSRAAERQARRRGWLRPLAWAVIAIVAASAIDGNPGPGTHGRSAAITAVLIVYAIALALSATGSWDGRRLPVQVLPVAVVGATGVALAALQPRGATEVAASAAVWMAVARLPLSLGIGLAAVITAGLDVALGLSDNSSAASVLAATLLCILLALMAHFMRQSRVSQDRTEMLLAELEDARDAQAEAAALAERGRIAGELHDVLAHSLSGAAIQLEGARMLAERDGGNPALREAVGRAGELVRAGLVDARRAVSALRGQELPSAAQLGSLVEDFRRDMNLNVELRVEGGARPLSAEGELALYRGAQEALTNVARYAPGATTTVVLRYLADRAVLTVDDRNAAPGAVALAGVGGGSGLAGMRERIERAGGTVRAGPLDDGWRVQLEVPF